MYVILLCYLWMVRTYIQATFVSNGRYSDLQMVFFACKAEKNSGQACTIE